MQHGHSPKKRRNGSNSRRVAVMSLCIVGLLDIKDRVSVAGMHQLWSSCDLLKKKTWNTIVAGMPQLSYNMIIMHINEVGGMPQPIIIILILII